MGINYMNKNNFPKFKVVLFNQDLSTRSFLWKKYSEFKNIKTLSSYNISCKENIMESYFLVLGHNLSPSDMSILSKEAIDLVKKSNKSHILVPKRETILCLLSIFFQLRLLIHMKNLQKGNYENINVEIPFNIPTVGCSKSFIKEVYLGLSE